MASSAASGFLTILSRGATVGNTSTSNYTAFAEIQSISGPSISRNMVDITNMDSPGGWREFVGGTIDPGEITLDVNFLPDNTTMNAAYALIDSTAVQAYLINWNGGTTNWVFGGWISGVAPSAAIDEPLSASVTIKLSTEYTTAAT